VQLLSVMIITGKIQTGRADGVTKFLGGTFSSCAK
jgi:hypothetical protein